MDSFDNVGGLNPFEFRASIQSITTWTKAAELSLNPFEFRASIQSLNQNAFVNMLLVLIPLNSGHLFSPACIRVGRVGDCLNPFEFRASIQSGLDGRCPDG